jgi:hypothetical protein
MPATGGFGYIMPVTDGPNHWGLKTLQASQTPDDYISPLRQHQLDNLAIRLRAQSQLALRPKRLETIDGFAFPNSDPEYIREQERLRHEREEFYRTNVMIGETFQRAQEAHELRKGMDEMAGGSWWALAAGLAAPGSGEYIRIPDDQSVIETAMLIDYYTKHDIYHPLYHPHDVVQVGGQQFVTQVSRGAYERYMERALPKAILLTSIQFATMAGPGVALQGAARGAMGEMEAMLVNGALRKSASDIIAEAAGQALLRNAEGFAASEAAGIAVESAEFLVPKLGTAPATSATGQVAELEVGQYGNLARRSVGDGLTPDHIPSFASVRANVERQLGRRLNPAEVDALYKETNTIIVRTRSHQLYSRTYGGRNTPSQVQADSLDLQKAFQLDRQTWRQQLINEGHSSSVVDEAFGLLDELNIQAGRY